MSSCLTGLLIASDFPVLWDSEWASCVVGLCNGQIAPPPFHGYEFGGSRSLATEGQRRHQWILFLSSVSIKSIYIVKPFQLTSVGWNLFVHGTWYFWCVLRFVRQVYYWKFLFQWFFVFLFLLNLLSSVLTLIISFLLFLLAVIYSFCSRAF